MKAFPFYPQPDVMDCGPACLRMIAKHYGKSIPLQQLREKSGINREGVSLLGLSEAAEAFGFRTLRARLSFEQLVAEAPLPCIAHWQQNHFLVVYRITKQRVYVADPGKDLLVLSTREFLDGWISTRQDDQEDGVALLLEPAPSFYEQEDEQGQPIGIARVLAYLAPFRQLLTQLGLGLLLSSILQLLFPLLTQAIVDTGIHTNNLNFIYLVLAAQLMLFAGRTAVEFIRSWILLHIGARVNIALLSDFWLKLMRLPLSFFDTKLFGDFMQRLQDHRRIEQMLTSTTLLTVFSLFSLVIFGVVLAFYYLPIFAVFLLGTGLYALWVFLFLKKRRKLDFVRFEVSARQQSKVVQLLAGMQEIKLSNSETLRRWEWEGIQARLFKLNVNSLALSQYQQAGAFFINEGKNILITFLAARAVIGGEMTLGAMLAVSYIIGQLNSPVEQLIGFMQTLQDASMSLERMNEIHQLSDEEPAGIPWQQHLPKNKSFYLQNVSFAYPGAGYEPVLKDIDLYIPEGKVTAIVGMSGSGKTTLLKLLLKFYEPASGSIDLGESNLKNISQMLWRSNCGVVMQDGYLFSDTIARNIALGDEYPDVQKLLDAARVANIEDFIASLPLGYSTKIGDEGNGLSQGQKQRILIARAVYKDPQFLFFDEATNALDANNERVIMQNLEQFFTGRTVVIVAHRLSTVQQADQIIVLDKGEIREVGTHAQLTKRKGDYYQLVKNQLELGV